VVSELATSAVAHAQTPFRVTLEGHHEIVRLAVQDESTSTLVLAAPDLMDMSGRGLMLVELLSDRWGTSIAGDGVKSVWALFVSHQHKPDPGRFL
jgi:hypothetical protein